MTTKPGELELTIPVTISTEDLAAIAHAMGRDEPTKLDLRRWILISVYQAVEAAKRRMNEDAKPHDPDIKF